MVVRTLKINEKNLVFLEHIAIIYSMDTLFAPWRMAYIRAEKREGCVLCRDSLRGDELVVHEGKSCFVTVNRYPYTGGHLMIVPYRHLGSLTDLLQEERLEVFAFMDLSVRVLTEAVKPQGFNLHLHVVPRWGGDTNFMSVIGDVRVIPEDVTGTAKELRPFFERFHKEVCG
jgi:ATP adenylyltransferase